MKRPARTIEEWLKRYNMLVRKQEATGFRPTSMNAREGLANLTASLVPGKPQVAYIQDELVYGTGFQVPVRIFHPQPEKELPVLIYFHGGGHMAGSVPVYDPILRRIALATEHVVVAPDYRLAPECPYPAGLIDCHNVIKNYTATLTRRGVNFTGDLAIGGDSAGGALTATLAMQLHSDREVCISRQILIYPSLDYTMQAVSVDSKGRGYLLEKDKIKWYFDNYFQHDEDRQACSPLFMKFSENLPSTLVVTAEFCPLRDEGLVYVEKLKNAGVTVRHLHFDDMIHAFMNMEEVARQQCESLYAEIGEFLGNSR